MTVLLSSLGNFNKKYLDFWFSSFLNSPLKHFDSIKSEISEFISKLMKAVIPNLIFFSLKNIINSFFLNYQQFPP